MLVEEINEKFTSTKIGAFRKVISQYFARLFRNIANFAVRKTTVKNRHFCMVIAKNRQFCKLRSRVQS